MKKLCVLILVLAVMTAAWSGCAFAQEPDVLVVGGGLAGLTATIKAVENGATVRILEMSGALGGNARYADGVLNGAVTKLQAEAGIEDSVELFYEDMVQRARGEENLNVPVARYYVENGGKMVDWLCELGVTFSKIYSGWVAYPQTNVPRCYAITGGGYEMTSILIAQVEQLAEEGKVEILLNNKVETMLMQDGACIGAKTEDGTEHYADAVILAAGGFAGSEELLGMAYDRIRSGALASNTGEGYRLALQTGAKISGMDYCWAYPGALPVESFFQVPEIGPMYAGGVIWVDKNGERVVNEYDEDGKLLCDAYLNAPDNTMYVILNQKDLLMDDPAIMGDANNAQFLAFVEEDKIVHAAADAAEIAAIVGVETSVIEATLADWNQAVAAGKDEEFGRETAMVAMEGPYYVAETVPVAFMSYGGVSLNENAMVVDENDQPIGNLFAAGECTNQADYAGNNGIGGGFLTCAVTLGAWAGEEAALHALAK